MLQARTCWRNELVGWKTEIVGKARMKKQDNQKRQPTPPSEVPVGIVSVGTYLPEPVLTAADIAFRSGLPEWVVRDKLGILQKHMAGPEDHSNQMAVWAAQDCLARAPIQAEEIDVVLCTTEVGKEYMLWTAGVNPAYDIGARRAWGIDL